MSSSPSSKPSSSESSRVAEEKMVKVPEKLYRQIELRAMRATELEQLILEAALTLRPYRLVGVITAPPTGDDAAKVFRAVETILAVAETIK